MTDSEVTTAITNLASGTPNTALELRDLFTELFRRCPKTGTIVIKDVSNQYITDNFDGTGLGINLEVGFARVNGNNGTRNWEGKVPVAYGGAYSTMGASGGSKDAIVVEHSHEVGIPQDSYGTQNLNSLVATSSSDEGNQTFITQTTGVSGTDKNMQPYIVTLVTMKL